MRAGTQLASWLQRISASASRTTYKGNGDGGKCERVANDATDAEGRALAVAVSVFHFAQRRGAQRAVRGHVSVLMAEGARTRAGRRSGLRAWTAGVGVGVKGWPCGVFCVSRRCCCCCGVCWRRGSVSVNATTWKCECACLAAGTAAGYANRMEPVGRRECLVVQRRSAGGQQRAASNYLVGPDACDGQVRVDAGCSELEWVWVSRPFCTGRFGMTCDGFSAAQGTPLHWPRPAPRLPARRQPGLDSNTRV
jgi:hypothetical protein